MAACWGRLLSVGRTVLQRHLLDRKSLSRVIFEFKGFRQSSVGVKTAGLLCGKCLCNGLNTVFFLT